VNPWATVVFVVGWALLLIVLAWVAVPGAW
jgi:hypothetical protein